MKRSNTLHLALIFAGHHLNTASVQGALTDTYLYQPATAMYLQNTLPQIQASLNSG